MPCYHPLPAWYKRRINPETGKRGITFRIEDGFADKPIQVPCGTCIGCSQVRARYWSVRCLHESKMHMWNWFVTFTYDDEHLPSSGSLSKRDWQLFMKRFRKVYGKVRFFMCGQYGERSLRPHYHALFFGVRFDDVRRYGGDSEKQLYVSRRLDGIWGLGECKISVLNMATIHYVTAYMGRSTLDKEKCSVFGLECEFQLMSRRPGLGRSWLERYWSDVYPSGLVVLRGGVKLGPPRYYDDYMEEVDPKIMRRLRYARREFLEGSVDNSGKRLVVREAVAEGKVRLFSGGDPD